MLVGLLSSKLNMSKVIITDRDIALMYVVAKVPSETIVLPCHFHIGKNVRGKRITNCKVKPNSNDVQVNRKEVKEEKDVRQVT